MTEKGWHYFWGAWVGALVVWLTVFLVAETYALRTDWRNTLSAQVWDIEKFQAQQHIGDWSAGHFLFAGFWLVLGLVVAVLWVWLFGHFIFGKWR